MSEQQQQQQQQHESLRSILDNDLYKFTMQYAVLKQYKRDIPVVYQFTNREKELRLNAEAYNWLTKQINDMENLRLTEAEREYMSKLTFFDQDYIDYLSKFRFRPREQVRTKFDEATCDMELEVIGQWHETILYEVPLLALISEAYFKFTDRDWNYDGQVENAEKKTRALVEHGCVFSEFGTRRRRDFKTHDLVMDTLVKTNKEVQKELKDKKKGNVSGTSNVYLAMKYNTAVIGTVAHEFFMGISALEGLEHANHKALTIWHDVFHGNLCYALTDTFTTDVFLKDFDKGLASKYGGVRHDSGSPFDFMYKMVDHYTSLGIDPKTKMLIFSDSLNAEKAIQLYDEAQKANINVTFGIGTSLTNDFHKASDKSVKSKALNIVIKLKECNGKRVIKLSDDALKHSADAATIAAFKKELGIAI
ncbi:nicotinate phosphoribosyltransferase [Mycotypha africana]|uniref:nicotinate phosphoribosyltransferase n=1 Tax=Mycotypha africana TaxID=64632 RepID=UPI0023006C15|nr:nicotinate phosphoribosyltransferase [Mycotypha africana]KAI8982247.1 nicotinate phosphoribosyltransferase [Mycotypha africana]